MKSSELREKYLAFFESKGCKRVCSSSLVPDDPSLLLTGAGMVQFKPYFLQQKQLEAPYIGAASVQKCVRTTDIDIIGTTGRHLSFFEMLGNFSFGAYFKKEMCAWAYEFSTDILGMDPSRLYFSVFLDDDETVELWKGLGVPEDHIRRLGEKDNFWRAGPTGPCGPCTELYYDLGPEFGCDSPDCGPGCDCERYIEYWNCVFTQYDAQEDGTLVPLPKKNIDTGMGLERTAAILQNVRSNYETDILRGLIAVGERLSGTTYMGAIGELAHEDTAAATAARNDLSLRILADHTRAVTFMIADGVLPSNEGRGYVLRRLLRRAMRHGQLIGIEPPFLGEYVHEVINEMGRVYPELLDNSGLIMRIVLTEEERFALTLKQGQLYLDQHIAALISSVSDETMSEKSETAPAEPAPAEPAPAEPAPTDPALEKLAPKLSGSLVFELHDRFGFPYDLTLEIAKEQGIEVDREGFEICMSAQRERARAHVKDDAWSSFLGVFNDVFNQHGATQFVGYTQLEERARVLAIIVDGAQVSSLCDGQAAQVILDRTPFYGEMGGQLGDTGELIVVRAAQEHKDMADPRENIESQLQEDTSVFSVENTTVFEKILYVHSGHINGTLSVNDTVIARIDPVRRERIQRNHTATHLLHYALQAVLGEHVKQAGSLVAPDRLRFDFTHFEPVSREQLNRIEELVNDLIMEDSEVVSYETSLEAARSSGVTALFGEKYDERVRVLEAGTHSRELCGGTHVRRTAQIGFLKILGETSVGANLRRIEAVTSFEALALINREEELLRSAAALLKVAPSELVEKIASVLAHDHELEASLAQFKKAEIAQDCTSLARDAFVVKCDKSSNGEEDSYCVVIARIDGLEVDDIRSLWDALREALGNAAAAVLGTIRPDGSPLVLAAATNPAVERGFDAGAVIKGIAPYIKGGGGGKPTMAQAGGKHAAGLDEALAAARQMFNMDA